MRTWESFQVDKWSAGCQVIADPVEFDVFMSLCRAASQVWGNHREVIRDHKR